MRRGIYLRVGIVVVVVALAALAYTAYTSARAQRRTVVAPSVRVEAGRAITAEMLSSVQVPADAPAGLYFSDPGEVVNRTALTTLFPGVPIARDAVGEPPPEGRLLPTGISVPPGTVALAVPVDTLGAVGGALKVGDTVSILAPRPLTGTITATAAVETEAPAEVKTPQTITYTVILSGVPVVDIRDAEGKSIVAGESGAKAAYVLIALSPQDAEKLARYRDILVLALEGK
ncbi:MAG: RcpC/CpaB family pilus assembly protein [Candidatus Micrarchaeaceae archaeon]